MNKLVSFVTFSIVYSLSASAMHNGLTLPELKAEIDTIIRNIDARVANMATLPEKICSLQSVAKDLGDLYKSSNDSCAEIRCRNIMYDLSDVRIYLMAYNNSDLSRRKALIKKILDSLRKHSR